MARKGRSCAPRTSSSRTGRCWRATPSGASTMTVFHLDGNELLTTHSCAQGTPATAAVEAHDGRSAELRAPRRDLASTAQSHLMKLELGIDGGRLICRETYVEAAKDDVAEFTFKQRSELREAGHQLTLLRILHNQRNGRTHRTELDGNAVDCRIRNMLGPGTAPPKSTTRRRTGS